MWVIRRKNDGWYFTGDIWGACMDFSPKVGEAKLYPQEDKDHADQAMTPFKTLRWELLSPEPYNQPHTD